MLEGLVAWVLNNYLGKYVQNLNTDQLSIALLSGEVELENLPLRKDALRSLGLPLQVRAGFIGRVRLQVPVRQFRSAPWVILIEQLNLVAGPINLDEWDADFEHNTALELKLSALESIETRWRGERENDGATGGPGYYASSYSSWVNYGTGLVTGIIENLQLKIRDVHIRYEDNISIPGQIFACGITFGALTAQGSPNVSVGTSSKIFELQNLTVYWDALEPHDLLGELSLGDLAIAMSKKQSHQYILQPVGGRAQLTRDRSEIPQSSRVKPRLVCDLTLDMVPLSLIDWQYEQMVVCSQGLENIARIRKFRENRPSVNVNEDPKAWWKYALTCQGFSFFKRPTWGSCLRRARNNVKYVEISSKLLLAPSSSLTAEQKEVKELMENELNFEELKILRQIAMDSIPKPAKATVEYNQGRSMLFHYFPQWWGWYSGSKATSPTNQNQIQPDSNTSELETEILDALADTVQDSTRLKQDSVLGQFNFTLKRGTFNVCMGEPFKESLPMLELHFESVHVLFETRPRLGSYQLQLALGGLSIQDRVTKNSVFPTLVCPQGREGAPLSRVRPPQVPRPTRSSLSNLLYPERASSSTTPSEPLFQLCYEIKPLTYNTDYRLSVKTQALDVVYNPGAVQWLIDFLSRPHQTTSTRRKIENMKMRTKMELIKNWEHILEGDLSDRKSWCLELDISAPQIIFLENFTDRSGSVVVLDFGRLLLTNNQQEDKNVTLEKQRSENDLRLSQKDSEDDEMFMTPCSTPPGSEASASDSPTLSNATLNDVTITEIPEQKAGPSQGALLQKIYDRYSVELCDLQVLVGRARDNWSFAHAKGTSILHVLDRFNISLKIERRLVHTIDPQYPSLLVSGILPRLVVHLAEQKVAALRTLIDIIGTKPKHSPFRSPTSESLLVNEPPLELTKSLPDHLESSKDTAAKLFTLQFSVEQLALEVQSRGRSVAELQVTGVRLGFTQNQKETQATLLVHSLLLVDALQTFGPDFELLVASHKHVGMDSVSGSLRDSEPCSPTSPASPDPLQIPRRATSPHQLSQALSSLQRAVSPTWPLNEAGPMRDMEALITVEVLLVTPTEGDEKIQVANIQFNTLDIIANQETIVELMGFAKRIFPEFKSAPKTDYKSTNLDGSRRQNVKEPFEGNNDSITSESLSERTRTEITFDFHRLNVLVLRAILKDGVMSGRKVATATMSEARIQSTIGSSVTVKGSLGGLQVLDLTPAGAMHQRVLSVGKDPLTEPPRPPADLLQTLTSEIYTLQCNQNPNETETQALSFYINRDLEDQSALEVQLRMASVWYTHSPHLLVELERCATEFQTYISNLAKNIKARATGMAIGLVQARLDTINVVNDNSYSPWKKHSVSYDTTTPPIRKETVKMRVKIDITLDTPVVVLPRSAQSTKVFVAHLGKISVNNNKEYNYEHDNYIDVNLKDELTRVNTDFETYVIDIRDMNLYSLDTASRRGFSFSGALSRAQQLYNSEGGQPVLHDTAIHLEFSREPSDNLVEIDEIDYVQSYRDCLQIKGSVVSNLRVSLSREQYEQLLDTVDNITTRSSDISEPKRKAEDAYDLNRVDIDTGQGTNFDIKADFELPCLTLELRGNLGTGNQGLVEISLRDFKLNYEKSNLYETNIQVSLRSLLMEDLLKEPDSKHRYMVVSSPEISTNWGNFISKSCPNLVRSSWPQETFRGSLPDHLKTENIFGNNLKTCGLCPGTPPPSPRHDLSKVRMDTLVRISALLVDPTVPEFESKYNSLRKTISVDFNSLDMVVGIESWLVVLDFFGLSDDNSGETELKEEDLSQVVPKIGKSEIEIDVRSLTLVLTRPGQELAKANISLARVTVNTDGTTRTIEGHLGSMSLLDLTAHGALYRERFATAGKEAFNFTYVTYDITNGKQKLSDSKDSKRDINRNKEIKSREYSSSLRLQMSSVRYVHTKRFLTEIQSFFGHFSRLQNIMSKLKSSSKNDSPKVYKTPSKLYLDIRAGSPVILLPVSTRSEHFLVGDLGELTIKNKFLRSDEPGTITSRKDVNGPVEHLDVMMVNLVNTDIFTGMRDTGKISKSNREESGINLVGFKMIRLGSSLLPDKCHLEIQIERNIDSGYSHNVADLSVQLTLSRLAAALDLEQYKLIRGLLMYNLGECVTDLTPVDIVRYEGQEEMPTEGHLWTLSCIRMHLDNVSLDLEINPGEPLACINFIKSRLTVEIYSDNTQDIDLVSQEILINDTRYRHKAANNRCNVFSKVLQPINFQSGANLVQVEVHSRKRRDSSKFTILLNNMRLMAILDWLEAARDYLLQSETPPDSTPSPLRAQGGDISYPIELKLNITDSELVFVEDASQNDTNAVILKSTSVVSYRPGSNRPLSVNLNQLELFSCVLGMEDDSALSIIDPVTVQADLNHQGLLEIQLNLLSVRLSYHDVRMFSQMLRSLPGQTLGARNSKNPLSPPANTKNQISKLVALGFDREDCISALEKCQYQLDEAALWLTKNAEHQKSPGSGSGIQMTQSSINVNALEIKANCLSICVIDDCRDSDVPLLELSLSDLTYQQDLGRLQQSDTPDLSPSHTSVHQAISNMQNDLTQLAIPKLTQIVNEKFIVKNSKTDLALLQKSFNGYGSSREETASVDSTGSEIQGQGVHLQAILASDYYNRTLSGWEPFIEPWKCEVGWKYGLTSALTKDRLQVQVKSQNVLNLNVTSTLLELYETVRKNWTQDYYSQSNTTGSNKVVGSPLGYRRRSPFVPFSLKNDTGHKLWLYTLVVTPDSHCSQHLPDEDEVEKWKIVKPGETVPFSFSGHHKQRHQDSHKLSLHQVFVRVEGWTTVGPVSVDKVGVYFRHANFKFQTGNIELPKARIVFSVTLEGSAQKLITVRSALRLVNQIGSPVQVKIENLAGHLGVVNWPPATETVLSPGSYYSIPLSHAHGQIRVRPLLDSKSNYEQEDFETQKLLWSKNTNYSTNPNQQLELAGTSTSTSKWDASVQNAIKSLQSKSFSGLSRQLSGFQYCGQPILWWQVYKSGEVAQELRACYEKDKTYRFVASIRRENYPMSQGGMRAQPAHTITLLPPLMVLNRLPCDLMYKPGYGQGGRVGPNSSAALTEIDLEKSIELHITLDNFPGPGYIVVPSGSAGTVTQRIRLTDTSKRHLYLNVTVTASKANGLQLAIWCPFWLVNRTGLPLVFRQEGANQDASGQGSEHEGARMVAPLLFSFADSDASPSLIMRRGKYYEEGIPQWSKPMHLQSGIQVRRLVTVLRDGRPERVALVGVEVRQGRGSCQSTIVTITPRYQLYNRSSHKLQFSQKCFATTVSDPGAQATHQQSTPGCHQPFHWPRLDKEQLLCIRIIDIPGCLWSGGIRIDKNHSLHVNIRDGTGAMHFLRLEVLIQGATYFVVLGDAQELPPSIRVDNYSQVPITVYQACCKDQFHSVARPNTAIAYALDEPEGQPIVCLGPPGGVANAYDIYDLGSAKELTYENFIYIAFSGTFKDRQDVIRGSDFDIDDQRLVLSVPRGDKVILSPKQGGDRSQLWRMTSSGQLQHEGSSPPTEPGRKAPNPNKILVLDIEGPAPQPSQYVNLVLRRPDPRRRSTQTWKFTEEGRLTCAHNNMCVQAKDGFFGLRTGPGTKHAMWQPWSEAVLGLPQPVSHRFTVTGVPLEQAVSKQRLRPGSGFLRVNITTDGPTKVLQIHDIKTPISAPLQCDWNLNMPSSSVARGSFSPRTRELQVHVNLQGGLGVSLVSRTPPEELLFMSLSGILVSVNMSRVAQAFEMKVEDIQIDNQLFEAPSPVLLHSRALRNEGGACVFTPAIHITCEISPSPNLNAVIFKHLIIQLRPLSIFLEERLLLRLADFLGLWQPVDQPGSLEDTDFEAQRIATQVTAANAKRYYFSVLQLIPGQIRLSMITASKLPPQLQTIKRHLGLTLIKFEDAAVELEAFTRRHPFETSQSLLQSIVKHYKDELKWQAASILGSVDFLGNPLGFMNDVSEGVSGLFYEGNVAALVKNVTHGISNSAAKVTESLSDGLGRVIMDEQHEETRQRIRGSSGGSGSHLVAGIKGLGFGLLGGVTSIVKQTYEGASSEGIQGFISGLGKGFVGTVTKPVVGVLDLASETASAIRDSSRSSSRLLPERRRLPRCITSGLGGLLPPFNEIQARGQQDMFTLNKRDYSEMFLGYEIVLGDLRVLISSEWVRFFTKSNEHIKIVLQEHLRDVIDCQPISVPEQKTTRHYIILTSISHAPAPITTPGSATGLKSPRVRCDNATLAGIISRQINYAKSIYEERLQTLICDINDE